MPVATDLAIQRSAPIPTWFGVGGGADRLARVGTVEQLRRALELDPALRILGDGANLLVDDDGVGELVVKMDGEGELCSVAIDQEHCRVTAGAGVNLPKLINETVRLGFAGLEGLAGIPATVGGAAVMNAGGTFAQFADAVRRVYAVTRDGADGKGGEEIELDRFDADFSYRHSGLAARNLIVTGVEFKLHREDPKKTRARQLEVMAYKKKSQPMADNSAGCTFKNPTLKDYLDNIGVPGARVSAGQLIDLAGCKNMKHGGARVSDRHANFFVAKRGCTARDVLALIDMVKKAVLDKFGVSLEPEVVIWRRGPATPTNPAPTATPKGSA
jgi:UDP-N-acetylmuramate dehydrogenase